MFDELCWRLVGDGVLLWRAGLYMGTLHPQTRGLGARWLREPNFIERYRILHGSEGGEEYLRARSAARSSAGHRFAAASSTIRPSIPCYPSYGARVPPTISPLRSIGHTAAFQ
jgi:hypothetical protein